MVKPRSTGYFFPIKPQPYIQTYVLSPIEMLITMAEHIDFLLITYTWFSNLRALMTLVGYLKRFIENYASGTHLVVRKVILNFLASSIYFHYF